MTYCYSVQTVGRLTEQTISVQTRVVSYFCSARAGMERPTYEIIIRTIARKLSLLPNHSLDPEIPSEYHKIHDQTEGTEPELPISFWEELCRGLIERSQQFAKLIILIDALDECSTVEDAEHFTQFMRNTLGKCLNVHFLCTSRQHINVGKYLPSKFYKHDISVEDTKIDLETFIHKEFDHRKNEQNDWDEDFKCVFCESGGPSMDPQRYVVLISTLQSKRGTRVFLKN